MKKPTCDNETLLLDALSEGRSRETFDGPLRAHLQTCPSCAELLGICELVQHDRAGIHQSCSLPDAAQVWFRAEIAFRRAQAERALQPIRIMEQAAWITGALGALIFLIAKGPWLANAFAHSLASTGAPASALLGASIIGVGAVGCISLPLLALYAVRTDR